MLTENQVIIEIKPMLYKIGRTKASTYWITDYEDGDDIQKFTAWKSIVFPLSMSNEEFCKKYRIITHSTFIKYSKMKQGDKNEEEISE